MAKASGKWAVALIFGSGIIASTSYQDQALAQRIGDGAGNIPPAPVEEMMPNGKLVGDGRSGFVSSVTNLCIADEMSQEGNKKAGFTFTQISKWCSCTAETVVDLVTPDEVRYLLANHAPPPSLMAKQDDAQDACIISTGLTPIK
jgi:hypothetical protein